MGFLDNSGDIILDAVLTDHGRQVLSRGDGSFQITKFALGDEEIDYSLYNTAHASGSAYYDLQILQTPVLESFTDNAASMKSKLVTYESFDLLFLPVVKLNESYAGQHLMHATHNCFIVAADAKTEDDDGGTTTKGIAFNQNGKPVEGVILGESLDGGSVIRLDQGLDTTQISARQNLPEELAETSYTIQIDNRLGQIVTPNGNTIPSDYIDDDDIAYYTVDLGDGIVSDITDKSNSVKQVISGPRGTKLDFKIAISVDLNTSAYLFTKLGGTFTMNNRGGGTTTLYYIDSIVRVTGVKTGYAVDIPVRFVKFKS
tara:strand:+ start:1332 stop:2276 length:945 start_codon:yes stop_codon:yes gene_type:complete